MKLLVALIVGLIVAVFAWGTFAMGEIIELRQDVNRVSNIQSRCAYYIEAGLYEADEWDSCIADYLKEIQASFGR